MLFQLTEIVNIRSEQSKIDDPGQQVCMINVNRLTTGKLGTMIKVSDGPNSGH